MQIRIIVALITAVVLAVPALFTDPWMINNVSGFVTLSNLPGSLCGLLFGGRFFPPEGYIGQSPGRWMLMVVVQTFVWFVIVSCFRFFAARDKKNDFDGTHSI
jgi:hypothetical protein